MLKYGNITLEAETSFWDLADLGPNRSKKLATELEVKTSDMVDAKAEFSFETKLNSLT